MGIEKICTSNKNYIFFPTVGSLRSYSQAKYYIQKARRLSREGKPSCTQNLAEECLQAQELVLPDGNPHVRRYFVNENGKPNICLWGDEMIDFIKGVSYRNGYYELALTDKDMIN